MAGYGGPVLVMQDTVFFSYGRHPKTRGLGPIGKSHAAHDRGLIMHNALAFTPSGVPLGIVSQSLWARGQIPKEDYQEKIEPCLSGWLPIKFFGESICHCTAFRTLEPLRWQPTQELS